MLSQQEVGVNSQINSFVIVEFDEIAINDTFYGVGLGIACCGYEED